MHTRIDRAGAIFHQDIEMTEKQPLREFLADEVKKWTVHPCFATS